MTYNQKMTYTKENQRLINLFRDEVSDERTNIFKNYRTSNMTENEYITQMENITKKEHFINTSIRLNNESFNLCIKSLNDIKTKITHLKDIYNLIYQTQSNDIETTGDSDFKYIPETERGFNGCYCVFEKDGFIYYLYENYDFSSIIKKTSRIDENVYLKNVDDIHTGKYKREQTEQQLEPDYECDDETEILTHQIDEFDLLIYKKKYYHANDGSIFVLDV